MNLFPMLLPFSKSAIPLFIRCFWRTYTPIKERKNQIGTPT
ncbi:hypothetical protein M103_1298 [Bacteroides fragilis str. 1007-1-F |nr:hypothetical protein M101_4956 [Bacteroides fragilis str. 1007-1-F \